MAALVRLGSIVALSAALAGWAPVARAAPLLSAARATGAQPAAKTTDKAAEKDKAPARGDANFGEANPTKMLEDPTDVRPQLAVWNFVVFLLLLAILAKFAWGPICAGLEKREKSIADNIAAAEEANDEARKLLAQHEVKLAGAADDVRKMLEEARRDAEHAKQEIIAEAKASAQTEHDRQMREIHIATDQALKSLAEASANLAVDLAGKIIQQKLTAKDHEGLLRAAIETIKVPSPSKN